MLLSLLLRCLVSYCEQTLISELYTAAYFIVIVTYMCENVCNLLTCSVVSGAEVLLLVPRKLSSTQHLLLDGIL